ncbi:MAG: hypothetical protein R2828_02530 [Saprospiraceae bacterium]
MNRRSFIKSNASTALAVGSAAMLPDFLFDKLADEKKSYAEYLRNSAVPKEELDIFLNEDSWAQFDPEVGYILGNYMPHDGIDNSSTLSTVMKDGKRTNRVYADKPCRINTYGNSFTHCHQVSDAETWQEYLAGHFGEPIQNFGMGGFGVYQAYRRLLRREKVDKDAKYVILYMWGDDYVRSVFRCRYATYYTRWNDYGGYMFHGNFWSNIEMDTNAGVLVEKENRISSKTDMYKMSDPEFMYDNLKDDLMVQLHLLSYDMVNADVDTKGLQKLADILELPAVDFSSVEKMVSTATALKNKYAFEATKYILKKTRDFCDEYGKALMLVHFDPGNVFKALVKGENRYDQEVIDFIKANDYLYFDMNEVHLNDFKQFNLTLEEYMDRYFIGHYTPSGNHFFAYAIKDKLVEWLDPKPITYQPNDSKLIRFKEYLPK